MIFYTCFGALSFFALARYPAVVVEFVLPILFSPNLPPEAIIDFASSTGDYVLVDQEVFFYGTNSRDPECKKLNFSWQIDQLGDDVLATEEIFKWTFEKPKVYTARLTVQDSKAATDAFKIIQVKDNEGSEPLTLPTPKYGVYKNVIVDASKSQWHSEVILKENTVYRIVPSEESEYTLNGGQSYGKYYGSGIISGLPLDIPSEKISLGGLNVLIWHHKSDGNNDPQIISFFERV